MRSGFRSSRDLGGILQIEPTSRPGKLTHNQLDSWESNLAEPTEAVYLLTLQACRFCPEAHAISVRRGSANIRESTAAALIGGSWKGFFFLLFFFFSFFFKDCSQTMAGGQRRDLNSAVQECLHVNRSQFLSGPGEGKTASADHTKSEPCLFLWERTKKGF